MFWNRRTLLSGRISRLATSSSQTLTESSLPLSAAGTRANAISRPSGDQLSAEGGLLGGSANSKLQEPRVSRSAGPPAVFTSQRWSGWVGFRRNRSWSPTSNELRWLASPSRLGASSYAA